MSRTGGREREERSPHADVDAFSAQAARVVEQLVALDAQYHDEIMKEPDRGLAFAESVTALAAMYNVRRWTG